MSRYRTIILWALTTAVAAGAGFLVGLFSARSAMPAQPQERLAEIERDQRDAAQQHESSKVPSEASEYQVVGSLTESERRRLLDPVSCSFAEGLIVTVSGPGKSPREYMAKRMVVPQTSPYRPPTPIPPGRSVIPPPPPPTPKPSLQVPDKLKPIIETIKVMPYPCPVGPNRVLGVCYERSF